MAYTALLVLGGALGGVVYLGTHPGASTAPAPAAATSGSASAGGPPAPAAAPGSLTFVVSADLTADEQAVLERLNQVRANPPAFLADWNQVLDKQLARTLPCTETAAMLDPLKAYVARPPLAANPQLTAAARAHARDELARGFIGHVNPDGIGSNQRVIAAGYPLPVGQTIAGFTYSDKRDAVNTESLFVSKASGETTFGAAAWPDAVDTLIVDACVPSRGHRDHILGVGGTSPAELEIGIGGISGASPTTKHTEMHVVIETATKNDGLFFVLGVVYRDTDADGHYDVGEGVAGVQIDAVAAGVTTKTGPGGGYALPVHDGVAGELVTPAGASLPFAVKGANTKLDLKLP